MLLGQGEKCRLLLTKEARQLKKSPIKYQQNVSKRSQCFQLAFYYFNEKIKFEKTLCSKCDVKENIWDYVNRRWLITLLEYSDVNFDGGIKLKRWISNSVKTWFQLEISCEYFHGIWRRKFFMIRFDSHHVNFSILLCKLLGHRWLNEGVFKTFQKLVWKWFHEYFYTALSEQGGFFLFSDHLVESSQLSLNKIFDDRNFRMFYSAVYFSDVMTIRWVLYVKDESVFLIRSTFFHNKNYNLCWINHNWPSFFETRVVIVNPKRMTDSFAK